MDDIPIELWKAAGDEEVDILWRICKLLMDKRGITCQQSCAEDHQRKNQATL